MSNLVRNERLKLAAKAFNTAATSCFAIGIATPLAAVFYNLGGLGTALAAPTLIVGLGVWLFAALTLLLAAQITVGRLRP